MKDPAALLPGLLAAYSPTGEEAGAVDFLLEAMQTMGYTVSRDGVGNAVGTRGEGPQEILLLGHIDTVPGVIPIRWEGDRLYGRGAVDAKGPLACFAAAGAAAKLAPEWRVTVIGALGEEGDSRGARYLCENYAPPQMVVIGEPSGWDHITLGYKGTFRCRYMVQKPLTHTAARAENACEQAVGFWNGIVQAATRWNEGKDRVFEQLTPALRQMQSRNDNFIETAEMRVGLRLPLGITRSELENLLAGAAGDGEIVVEDYIPAYKGEKNNALVRGLLAGIRAAGGQPSFSLKTGTADMNLVGPVWNCPIVAYGPGDSGLDHTPNEHILLSEYLRSVEILTQALEYVMQSEQQPLPKEMF
ncbi:MAG: [LysW]-lysine hydrolase [Anaerolineaceae bacterium]|nr:[LysW]-lysine hydrolase [Anaerolineaceae bacterium]